MTDRRTDLLEAVQNGTMCPAEADAEATALGLEALSSVPDPSRFDPMREPFWTPAMAVSWIAWRNADAVREAWDDYRRACRDRHAATLSFVRFAEAANDDAIHPSVMTVADSVSAFFAALRQGGVTATGIPLGGGGRVTIPAVEWMDLDHYGDFDEDAFKTHPVHPDARGYRSVLLPRDVVLKRWPRPPSDPVEGLPPARVPESGFMPVFYAALWIATEGGTRDFEPTDRTVWSAAYRALLQRIAAGEVALTGIRAAEREKIDPHVVADCRIDLPYCEDPHGLAASGELHLRSHPHIDEEDWRNGFDDALCVGVEPRRRLLMVAAHDIRVIWPFTTEPPQKTGAPGRPSSAHLVAAEFERIVAAGEIRKTLAEQARVLEAWLKKRHPPEKPMTPKTIENRIRRAFNAARAKPTKL